MPIRKTTFELIFVVAFVVLIVSPNLDTIFKIDPTQQRAENRARAKFPTFPQTGAELKSWLQILILTIPIILASEIFLLDFNARTEVFRAQNLATDRVVIGRDGWLFLARQDNIDSYRNLHPFTEEELQAFVLKLKREMRGPSKKAIQYIYMVGARLSYSEPRTFANLGPQSSRRFALRSNH